MESRERGAKSATCGSPRSWISVKRPVVLHVDIIGLSRMEVLKMEVLKVAVLGKEREVYGCQFEFPQSMVAGRGQYHKGQRRANFCHFGAHTDNARSKTMHRATNLASHGDCGGRNVEERIVYAS